MKSAFSARLALFALFASLTACERNYDLALGDPGSGNSSGLAAGGAVPSTLAPSTAPGEPGIDQTADDDIQIVNSNTNPAAQPGSNNDGSNSNPALSSTANPSLPSNVKSGVCPAALNPGLFQLGGHLLRAAGSADLKANMMLGRSSTASLVGSINLQSLVKDPSASVSTAGSVSIASTRTIDVSANVRASLAASDAAAALAATHAVMDLAPSTDSNAFRVAGNGGLNVIPVSNLDLQGSNTLTLTGGANDTFVFNVSGRLRVGGSFALVLEGGVKANNVLFNVIGDGQDVDIAGSAALRGTILTPRRSVTLEGSSQLQGALVAGGDINLLGSVGAFKQATMCDTK